MVPSKKIKKQTEMGDEPLVPQRVENAIRKRLQELALVDCEPDIAAFAACAQER